MLHCFTRCRFATGWINSQGDTARWKSAMIPCRRENRSRSPYRILSPLFKISTEASVSSRLYCRAYTAITFLRGAGRCLRAQVYACVVNAISSFLILLRVFLSRGKKKGCNFSFLFLLINGRRGEWRGGCLLSFSIRLIRMISFTVSVAWLGDFVIVVVYE